MALNASDTTAMCAGKRRRIVMEDTTCAPCARKDDIREFYLGMKEEACAPTGAGRKRKNAGDIDVTLQRSAGGGTGNMTISVPYLSLETSSLHLVRFSDKRGLSTPEQSNMSTWDLSRYQPQTKVISMAKNSFHSP
jgi:hypothetical protein